MSILTKVLPLFVVAAGALTSSCTLSDDDEPNGGGGNAVNGYPRLTAVSLPGMNVLSFTYDGSGRPVKIVSKLAEEVTEISYSPLRIETVTYDDGVIDERTVLEDISLSSSGAIVSCKMTEETYWDGHVDQKEVTQNTYKYNASNNIIRVEMKDVNSNDVDVTEFNWLDGNLLKATAIDEYSGNEERTYQYSATPNACGQWSIMWEIVPSYAMFGFYGTAPKALPASMTGTDGEKFTFAYRLNSNGTIAAEQVSSGGETITFTYKY